MGGKKGALDGGRGERDEGLNKKDKQVCKISTQSNHNRNELKWKVQKKQLNLFFSHENQAYLLNDSVHQ